MFIDEAGMVDFFDFCMLMNSNPKKVVLCGDLA